MLTRRAAVQGMLGAAITAAMPANVEAQAPWPDAAGHADDVRSFNDGWRFHRGDVGGAEAPGFDDSHWRILDVPHDWSIEDLPGGASEPDEAIWAPGPSLFRTGPFDLYASEGQGATGWTVGGVGWYRKTFSMPSLRPPFQAELRFEGVYLNSDVWLNGVHLGNHPYGYTEFAFNLTPHLHEGGNVVAVRVANTGRNSRWYSGSGIYRKVWLTTKGDVHIPAHGVWVTTPEVTSDAALVRVAVTLANIGAAARRAMARVRLVDADGLAAGEAQESASVPAAATGTATCEVRLKNPRLWSPGDPHLYRAEIEITADGSVADTAGLNVGVRSLEVDAQRGLRINGKEIKLRGGCVHTNDHGPLGSVCIPRAEQRRVEILRANGFNAIRTSHNPPSRDFLEACDRAGMLVIDEAFDTWETAKNPDDYHLYFKDWWQRDLESMILRDRNHPCVILWSIGNEIEERAEPRGVEIGKELAAYAHKLDPTRKVTAAICGPYDHPKQTWQDMEPAFSYLDVGGYNYEWEQYASDHAKYPERVMVGTESFPSQAVQNWQAVEKDKWVIGDFVWTAIDYMGESGIGRASIRTEPGPPAATLSYPWFNSYCGDIDLIGDKKPPSYFRDVVWRRSTVEMAVQRPIPKGWTEQASPWGWSDELRSWTWPGFEGSLLTVRVYTRGSRVTLLVNGREFAAKDLSEQDALRAEFSVPYTPGELRAVVYDGGRETGNLAFRTAGKAAKLLMNPDRANLHASRDDLGYVLVTVADERGQGVPDAVVPVSFSVNGAGEIAAVGNGNPREVASFRQPRRDTFHGACMIVVRPTGKPGAIELRAESPGLEPATTKLVCNPL